MSEEKKESLHFLEQIVEEDLKNNTHGGRVLTRFPPEPNGYLHIGHAKSICLNFGLAKKYGGTTNLRFDDTNPVTEDTEYVESIKADIRWLGFDWARELYASDYFEQLYNFAKQLITNGKAYVDFSTADEIAIAKGTPTTSGTPTKYRDSSPEDNIALFQKMRNGDFKDGECVLRAKIDLSAPNMHLRDPLLYRIKHAHHHRTGNNWCIYPMYDFAHGQSDSIEQITHSVCTLEFVPHRALYDWFIAELKIFPSKQYEFARLNLTYTVMSKRKLLQLVNENTVSGWDDPRMPTLSGMRRRGYTPASIREFAHRIGVAKRDNLIDMELLEFCVREDLNKMAPRVMAVLDPIKVIITNYDAEKTEFLTAENNPEDENAGSRIVPFGKEIWIERDDFMENPPKKYFRLSPNNMVRLKNAYIIRCDGVEKDAEENVTILHCSYFLDSKSGNDTSGISVKGTIHWVAVAHALEAEVRHYDRLLTVEDANAAEGDFKDYINPNSKVVLPKIYVEQSLADAKAGSPVQFIRKGYYCLDTDSTAEKLVFNRTVGLKDSWKG